MAHWRSTLVLLCIAVTAGGCETPKAWTKDGGSGPEFAATRAACQQTSARTPLDSISAGFGDRFQACMERDGWRLVEVRGGAR
ncbi:MAG: hypothetical protein HY060_07455 [Proteobacteria bacterium]|nr:hypothetical protein [Pseudomonadota bacterium]